MRTGRSRSGNPGTSSATASSPSCLRCGPRPAVLPSMTTDLELARQQWRDGNRRLEAARGDRERYRELVEDVDRVIGSLRPPPRHAFPLDPPGAAAARAKDPQLHAPRDAQPPAVPRVQAGLALS